MVRRDSWRRDVKDFIDSQEECEIMRGYGRVRDEWQPLSGIVRKRVHDGWEYTMYKDGQPLWKRINIDESTLEKLKRWDKDDLYSTEQERMVTVWMRSLGYTVDRNRKG